MKDRISVKVEFRKALWICPKCGQEDIEDFIVSGGNTYEHNCSICGTWFNSYKEFNGCLSYSPEDYAKKEQEDIDTEKSVRVEKWIYEIKHPPVYVEPTKADLEQLKLEKQREVDELQSRIDAKVILEE